MKYDYSKLAGRITEKFGTQRAFAKACGFSEKTVSKKLKLGLTIKDIENWSKPELLDIPAIEYPEYYFRKKGEQ